MNIKLLIYIAISFLLLLPAGLSAQSLVNLKGNVSVKFSENSLVKVNGSLNLETGSQLTPDGNLDITNDLINAGSISTELGTLVLTGNDNSNIQGSGTTELNNLTITKTLADVNLQRELELTGDILISTGSLSPNANTITLEGDFTNNDTFNQATSTLILSGDGSQTIGGASYTNFNILTIDKSAGDVELDSPIRIAGQLNIISNTIFDLNNNDLTLSPTAWIYSDNGVNRQINIGFSVNKCLVNSGSSLDPLDGAFLIKELPTSGLNNYEMNFPFTTPGVYTPTRITLNPNGVSVGSNPIVRVKPVPLEHPKVERTEVALEKYWVVESEDITVQLDGITILSYYESSEVQGSEGNYQILLFSPSYDDINGYWRINPGQSDDIVDFNDKLWYSQQASELDGDWTIGERSAAQATYYAIADGDYNDPTTWSKVYFDGDVSNTAPNKRSDIVRIQDHTITVSSGTAPSQKIALEQGTEGRGSGILVIEGNNFIEADSILVETTTTLRLAHQDGVAVAPATTGALRADISQYSSDASYWFIGDLNQNTGSGLPNTISNFYIDKDPNAKVSLSKPFTISNSLTIEDGILDLIDKSINGLTPGKTLTMNGGELILPAGFPTNYTSPTFTAGKITFDGTGAIQIPSSTSTPGVAQYFDLTIKGTRSGDITFVQNDEIRINNDLDVSELVFTNITYSFQVFGSTIVFNKNSGVQLISTNIQSPSNPENQLQFYNLILDSAGTKRLFPDNGSLMFTVRNNLELRNDATLESNGNDLTISGNWLNTAGVFLPGTDRVIFNSDVTDATTNITSRNIGDNPFYDVDIIGDGKVQPLDDILVNNDLTLRDNGTLKMTTHTITVNGDWNNDTGTYEYGTSTAVLSGSSLQSISNTSGNEQFYNLTVNNSENINSQNVGIDSENGIVVNGTLNLEDGIIISRGRHVTALGSITRNFGFIDGQMRRNIPAGVSGDILFHTGFADNYLPATFATTGSGGTAGLVGIISDTINLATSSTQIIAWNQEPPTDLVPTGGAMSAERHIARQWLVEKPTGSNFVLGANRRFNITFGFNPGTAPNGDLRGGANPNDFEARVLNSSDVWIKPFHYGTFPIMGSLTSNSTQYTNLVDFGSFIIGEPDALTYYSRADGNWNNNQSWSQQGFGGVAANSYPGQLGNTYKVFIANENTITLTTNITLNDDGAIKGLIQVDSTGGLMTADFIVQGSGEFRLGKDATLGIGNSNGIRQTGSFGSIQTTIREFNYDNHNRGIFVYTGSVNQTQANEGLPAEIAHLKIDKSANSLILNRQVTIADSLLIENGTLFQGAELTVNGNWVNYGTYTHNNQIVNFNSSELDSIKANSTQTFYQLRLQKNDGKLITNQPIIIENLLHFRPSNNSIIVAQESGTYVEIAQNATLTRSDIGHIYGELRKYVGTSDPIIVNWEVGNDSLYGYRPYNLTLNGSSGTAGMLAVRLFEGVQPNFGSLPSGGIDVIWLVNKFWRVTFPTGSSFALGTRTVDIDIEFINPEDLVNGAVPGCFDVNFWDSANWRVLNKSTSASNYEASNCANRPIGTYTYTGSPTSVQVYDVPANLFGSSGLFGDFITGRGVEVAATTFYSRQSGNWSAPETWSTTGYGGAAASRFPREFFDVARIGNPDVDEETTVTLDVCIGHGYRLTGAYENFQYSALRAVNVERGGRLSLGTNFIYTFGITVQDSAFLEVGSIDGIINRDASSVTTGNIWAITYSYYDETVNNNFVYTADGLSSPFVPRSEGGVVPPRATDNSDEWIQRVQLGNIDNTSGQENNPVSGFQYFPYNQTTLVAGQQYSITLTPGFSGGAINQRWRIWIDYNLDGEFIDGNPERVGEFLGNSSAPQTINFTVPNDVTPGTTRMRVRMWRNTEASPGPTGNNTRGEVEDYSIKIVNPNYQTMTQVTGTGLPNKFGSLTINTARGQELVNLGKNIEIENYLTFTNGSFTQGDNSIVVNGNINHNIAGGFVPHASQAIQFAGTKVQDINGSEPIAFNNVQINKTGTNKVNLNNNSSINGTLTFNSNNNLVLNSNNTITFTSEGNVSAGSGSFSANRMIELDGVSDVSKVIKEFGASALNYCVPELSATGQHITNVNIPTTTLNNSSNNPTGYSDFTGLTPPTLVANTNYTLNATKSTQGFRRWSVWIDYNQDGSFDVPGEQLTLNNQQETTFTFNFTIPLTALNGYTRMRIRMRGGSQDVNPSCEVSTSTDGEFEDYTINITGGTDSGSDIAFLYPIGIVNEYSPADFDLTASVSGQPSLAVWIKDEQHPERNNNNILSKYWRVESTGISNVIGNSFSFTFDDSDVNGDIDDYIPSRYTTDWEINLGEGPEIVGNNINITPTAATVFDEIDGDWTAGIPTSFFTGRIFYSRNIGLWTDPNNWSNDTLLKHNGLPSSYYPSDIFFKDTVYIDGHTITFDPQFAEIDIMQIGGTNAVPANGILQFNATNGKNLLLRELTLVDDAGEINAVTGGTRRDTITVTGDIINNSINGLNLYNSPTNYTSLKFAGAGNSNVSGTGNFNSFGRIILQKEGGLLDKLLNTSLTFADATNSSTNYQFLFNSGVLEHNLSNDFSIGKANNITMQPGTAINILQGSVSLDGSLTNNSNTFITLDGGDLFIGNSVDENFLYRTGSVIDVLDGRLEVAGAFTRRDANSLVTLTLAGTSEIHTATSGYTGASAVAFDLANSGSVFNMPSGRIVVANSNPSASYDVFINAANGTLMTGGVLQIGDTNLTANNSTFKLGGTMPITHLHLANDGVKNIATNLNETSYTVLNLFESDINHTFNLNGNTLRTSGDIINNGIFNGTPSSATTDSWTLAFFGNDLQTLTNNTGSEFAVFNIRMDKGSESVLLDNTAASNLLINNSIEFTNNNTAFINALQNDKYVSLLPLAFNSTFVQRTGQGHIAGAMDRLITGNQNNIFYPIGTANINEYRPALFTTTGISPVETGIIRIENIAGTHPDIDFDIVNSNNYVEPWWRVTTLAANPLDLGTGSCALQTQYRNPEDINGTGDIIFYEHFTYNGADWEYTNTTDVTTNSVRSNQHTDFYDFVIGEPQGVTFYSIQSGSWTDFNTWSLDGYEPPYNIPVRYPNDRTDIVRIGNNRRVVLPNLIYPEVRSVFVEVYDNKPGTLKIEGDLNYIRGNTFVLEDVCTIELEHLQGIQPAILGPVGAIQTDTRTFGKSRYVYNSNIGSQTTGLAIPTLVKALIIDNPNPINRTVRLSNTGSEIVNVEDTLLIRQGRFESVKRGFRVQSNLIIDSVAGQNNGVFLPLNATVYFGGNTNNKYLTINNNTGIRFHNLTLEEGDLFVNRGSGANPQLANVFVANNLNFPVVGSLFMILGDNVSVFIQSTNTNAITNFDATRHIRTSRTSGTLKRNIATSGSYSFPIGSFESGVNYAPVELEVQSGTTAGYVGIRTSPGDYTSFPGGHPRISPNPAAEYLQRYWAVDSVSTVISGKLRFNYKDTEISGTETNIDRVGRWRPVLETVPGSWTVFQSPNINVDYASNFFETENSFSSTQFSGDWTIGNLQAFRRIFFSRQNGIWSEPESWTYQPTHTGLIFGPGLWPNSVEDSVVIGAGHEIFLDQTVDVQGTALGTTPANWGILNTLFNNTSYILGGEYFTMSDNSHLKIASPDGISILGNAIGSIQTTLSRQFAVNATYEYNGIVNQVIGNGLPSQFDNLIINNSGDAVSNNNNVTIDRDLIINQDLNVVQGAFNMATFKADKAVSAGDFSVASGAQVRIAGINSMLDVLNNYSTYTIDTESTFNFYGSNQTISSLPIVVPDGFGNVTLQNAGNKIVAIPLLIRGNLFISNDATLINEIGVNALTVHKNIINSATVNNSGIIEIGIE